MRYVRLAFSSVSVMFHFIKTRAAPMPRPEMKASVIAMLSSVFMCVYAGLGSVLERMTASASSGF